VVFVVGKAQEKCTVYRTERRRNPRTGTTYLLCGASAFEPTVACCRSRKSPMTTSWRKNLPADQRSASDRIATRLGVAMRRSQSTSTLECLVGVQLLTGGFLQRKSPRAFRIPVRPNHTPAWPRPHDLPAPDRSVTASPTPASVRLYSLRASTLPSCVPVSPKHYPKYPAPTPPYAVASTNSNSRSIHVSMLPNLPSKT
jgi:hypothetical protein